MNQWEPERRLVAKAIASGALRPPEHPPEKPKPGRPAKLGVGVSLAGVGKLPEAERRRRRAAYVARWKRVRGLVKKGLT